MRQNTWTGDTTVANVQKQWFSNLLYQTDCLLLWSKIQFQILPIAREVACIGVGKTEALLRSLNFILLIPAGSTENLVRTECMNKENKQEYWQRNPRVEERVRLWSE